MSEFGHLLPDVYELWMEQQIQKATDSALDGQIADWHDVRRRDSEEGPDPTEPEADVERPEREG